MGAIAAWIGGVITSLAGQFGLFFTKRVALTAAAITVIVALTTGLWAALEALVTTFDAAVPDYFSVAASWFVPYNAEECVAAVITGHILRKLYEIKMLTVQMRLL